MCHNFANLSLKQMEFIRHLPGELESYFGFKEVFSQPHYSLSANLWPKAPQSDIINLILKRRVIYFLWHVKIIKQGAGRRRWTGF